MEYFYAEPPTAQRASGRLGGPGQAAMCGRATRYGRSAISVEEQLAKPARLTFSSFCLMDGKNCTYNLREPRVSTWCSHKFGFGPQSALH
jgi:hypothetical protein